MSNLSLKKYKVDKFVHKVLVKKKRASQNPSMCLQKPKTDVIYVKVLHVLQPFYPLRPVSSLQFWKAAPFISHATLNVLTWHFPPSIQSLSDDKHWKQKGNWIDDRRVKIWPCCGTGTILTHTSQVSPNLAAISIEILQSIAAEIQSRSPWTCTPWFMLCGQWPSQFYGNGSGIFDRHG